MKPLKIEISPEILSSLKFPPDEREQEIREELALALYNRGALGLGKARELTEMDRWEFHEFLGKRGVGRHYDDENLEEDMDYARDSS